MAHPKASTSSGPRASTPFSVHGAAALGGFGGAVYGAALLHQRSTAQAAAIANPASVGSHTRLAALAAAQSATGSLGTAAASSIRGIHTLFGSHMEAGIGSVFRSPPMRALMNHSAGAPGAPSSSNQALAQNEHGYWAAQRNNASSSVGNVAFRAEPGFSARLGGQVGNAFTPYLRAQIQASAATFPRLLPALARAGVAGGSSAAGMAGAAALGAIGSHIHQDRFAEAGTMAGALAGAARGARALTHTLSSFVSAAPPAAMVRNPLGFAVMSAARAVGARAIGGAAAGGALGASVDAGRGRRSSF
jgi:hypothetical protein